MRLDGRRRTFYRYRFDYIGIQGSLNQETHGRSAGLGSQAPRLFRKDGDEFRSNAFAFVFGVRHTFQAREESLRRIDARDVEAKPVAQQLQSFGEFVLPQQTCVDEDIYQLIANG